MSAAAGSGGVPTKAVHRAVKSSDLCADSRHIMHVLALIADYQTSELPPQFTPSTGQLARETGLSESTVIRRRKELEAAGWIVLRRPTPEESVRRVRIRYQLAIPATGAHRAHAEAAERLLQGLADTSGAEIRTDEIPSADTRTGFTVPPPEDSPWTPTTGVTQTAVQVSEGHPSTVTQPPVGVAGSHPTGVSLTGVGVSGSYPNDCQADTSITYYLPASQNQKPPAGAGGREQRLAIAEELTEKFWRIHGTGSAQRRPAVRAVIITAVADNAVPRDDAARALDVLARAGKQITGDSLTKALAQIRPADTPGAAPSAPAPRPPRRFCPVPDHAAVELTPSGLCPNCAADAKAAPVDHEIPPPRHALHDDTQLIPAAAS